MVLSRMAKCIHCGAETRLYNNGVPVCIACVDLPATQKSKPPLAGTVVTALSVMGLPSFVVEPPKDTALES
jgi:hypothetical protein